MKKDTEHRIYGPWQPRIARKRSKVVNVDRNYRYTQLRFLQTGGRYTYSVPAINPAGNAVRSNKFYCEDTIRNPQYPFPRNLISDDGGEFLLRKSTWLREPGSFSTGWKVNTRDWGASVSTESPGIYAGIDMTALDPPTVDYTDIPDFGPEGWRRAKPAAPLVDLAVFIAELRDLPDLLKARLRDIRTISDFYLAVQFGWKPLLSDILKLLEFGVKVEKSIAFLLRNNGKPIRRRVKVLSDHHTETIREYENLIGVAINWAAQLPGYRGSSGFARSALLIYERDIWFSGEFIFYIDDIALPGTIARLYSRLLGLKITPAVVWRALPWSWLADWFSNVGDVLSNLSEQVADRQVAKYAYIMGHTKRTYKWFGTDGTTFGQSSHIYETKVRRKVHPYGLAVGGGPLTTTQQAILAALSASRTK